MRGSDISWRCVLSPGYPIYVTTPERLIRHDRAAANPVRFLGDAPCGTRGFCRKDAARAVSTASEAFACGIVARAAERSARERQRAACATQDARAAGLALALCAWRPRLR